MKKIDPVITNSVRMLNDDDTISCVVYTYNYNLALKNLTNMVGANHVFEYPFINAVGMQTKLGNIYSIANLDCVKYVSSALKVSALVDKSNEFLGTNNLVVPNSNNISIAVIDTGCSPHIDLMIPKRVIKFVDIVNDKKYMYDDNGHGTFVAGVIAGSGAYSGGKYQGIDKDANLVIVKALDNSGQAGALSILNAMQWIYNNSTEYNIKVVCMSFGSIPVGVDDPLIRGAEALWDRGIVVVAAAGNSGPNTQTIKAPGASSKIITVGALDVDKFTIAQFSSRGPSYYSYKPDLVAPGVNVVGLNHDLFDYPYVKMSGTSVATPMIAGICSNIIKLNPALTPNRVKSIILNRCTPITNDKNIEGFGYYDKNKS